MLDNRIFRLPGPLPGGSWLIGPWDEHTAELARQRDGRVCADPGAALFREYFDAVRQHPVKIVPGPTLQELAVALSEALRRIGGFGIRLTAGQPHECHAGEGPLGETHGELQSRRLDANMPELFEWAVQSTGLCDQTTARHARRFSPARPRSQLVMRSKNPLTLSSQD